MTLELMIQIALVAFLTWGGALSLQCLLRVLRSRELGKEDTA
jgi:hypothetical protein